MSRNLMECLPIFGSVPSWRILMVRRSIAHCWNCGEEGPTRKKSIKLLRKKMWRNAWLLLMLSQGTPLIHAGDEFGQSRLGNNNPYCQDNPTNWLDWRLIDRNRELYDFARYAIQFRKQHPVFHQGTALRQMDYRSVGIPDISFHGENAWRPDSENDLYKDIMDEELNALVNEKLSRRKFRGYRVESVDIQITVRPTRKKCARNA